MPPVPPPPPLPQPLDRKPRIALLHGTAANEKIMSMQLMALIPKLKPIAASISTIEGRIVIEKDNPQLAERIAWVQAQRKAGLPTVPSTIAAELATNPFLRCDSPSIQALCECVGNVELAFAKLRRMKDNF